MLGVETCQALFIENVERPKQGEDLTEIEVGYFTLISTASRIDAAHACV